MITKRRLRRALREEYLVAIAMFGPEAAELSDERKRYWMGRLTAVDRLRRILKAKP